MFCFVLINLNLYLTEILYVLKILTPFINKKLNILTKYGEVWQLPIMSCTNHNLPSKNQEYK